MTTWRAIYERMFERGPDSFSQPERETIRAAIEEAWNAGVAVQKHPVGALREALHRLVDSVTAWGARERVAIPADVTAALCDAARALESETREAALCRCGHGEKAHSPDGWCEFDDCLCTYFRPPPPANTENDR